MSFSYSGVVGYGKTTLPSVESWGENMNILRDPPSSIHTRKIDKVGETSEITQMIQESGDRICEGISVYARGVNPMVSVSYDNNGKNGGQTTNSGKQSFLPYRVMRDGAFRPPIRDQRTLLPLSRLPRVWTSQFSQPSFTDFSKKAMCPSPNTEFRGVKKEGQMLKACVRPNATYQIKMPVKESYDVKYMIKNPLNISLKTGKNSVAKFNGEHNLTGSQINDKKLNIKASVNMGGHSRINGELSFNTEKFIQDSLKGEYNGNKTRNVNTTNVEDYADPRSYIQDNLQGEYNSNKTRNIQNMNVDDYADPRSYIQEVIQGEYNSNKTRNVNTTNVDDYADPRSYIQEAIQ